jgi:hypothetical protein
MSISSISAGIMGTAVEDCNLDKTFRASPADILYIGGPRCAFSFSRKALATGSMPLNVPVVTVLIGNSPALNRLDETSGCGIIYLI